MDGRKHRDVVCGRQSGVSVCPDFRIGTSIVFTPTGTVSLAKTTQTTSMEAFEGQNVNISCSHPDIATNEYIFWYQQFPNQGPQFLIRGYKVDVEHEATSLFIAADRKSSTLGLPQLSLKDTAVYYCTVGGAQ